MELGCYDYDIMYRSGKNNTADILSREHCRVMVSKEKLYELHLSLCHPGITRLSHFVKIIFYRRSEENMYWVPCMCSIKTSVPLIRFSWPNQGHTTYGTTQYGLVIDEYSRFPFAFSCPNMATDVVIKCLSQLFAMFGMPSYIHTNRSPHLYPRSSENTLPT